MTLPGLDPALDAGAPRETTRSYVVCSTPRSGSGLLCRGLRETGVAGWPTEYLNPNLRAELAGRWGAGGDLRAYARLLRARRTGANGVFGVKVHWLQHQRARAELLGLPRGDPGFGAGTEAIDALAPGAVYVRMLRRDVDRQAVSTWLADATGVFSLDRGAARPRPARYSFTGILDCRRRIALAELHWDRFFRHNRIDPVVVEYEDLDAGYEDTLRRVLARVAPDAGDVAIAPPAGARMSDERSEALLARFRRDLALVPPRRRVLLDRLLGLARLRR